MNTITFDKMQADKENGWVLFRDFRSRDVKKLQLVLTDMLKKLQTIRSDFSYSMKIKDGDASYSGGYVHKVGKINLVLSSGKFMNEINLEFPKLVNDNLFILGGSTYVPILFLERAPIDRVGGSDQPKNKILLNLFSHQIDFDFKAQTVKLQKNKQVDINVFFTALFYDKAYKEILDRIYKLFGKPTFNNRELTYNECKARVLEAFGITGQNRFKNMEVDEFIDSYLMLNYTKEVYQDYYGISDIKTIVRLVLKYYETDFEINMSDVRNRRIVMTEYLMIPVFNFYQKILTNFMDSDYKDYLLPPLANNSIIAESFRGIMHGEQLYNVTLPYIAPLVHKVSQNIIVINSKVPKKWTSNHPSAMGIFCPISVSAQDMGQNLVATLNAEVNFYGRIKSFVFPEYDDLRFNLDIIKPSGESSFNMNLEQKGNHIVDTKTGEVIQTLEDIDIIDK